MSPTFIESKMFTGYYSNDLPIPILIALLHERALMRFQTKKLHIT